MARKRRRRKAKPGGGSAELEIGVALEGAMTLHKAGGVEGAEKVYARILEVAPGIPEAWNFRGVAAQQLGRKDDAVAFLERAVALAPDYADAHSNLGNVYQYQRRFPEAVAAYQRAIGLRPELAEAHFNLGKVLEKQNLLPEALSAYRQAVRLRPAHGDTYRRLGGALYSVGRPDEAAEVYAEWMAREPDNPVARHLWAACSGREVPDRASDAVVQAVFDKFAESFDDVLRRLEYRAPALIAQAVSSALPAPEGKLDIVDLGCGTGLCGPDLRAHARRLVGVDLSGGMLAKASARGTYDELIQEELTAFLGRSGAAWDVAVSADTLVYLGDLAPVLAAAARALRPGGLLVFTVERLLPDDSVAAGYRLEPHGRYSHGETYLRQSIAAAGLEVHQLSVAHLRLELKRPVEGLLVVAGQRS